MCQMGGLRISEPADDPVITTCYKQGLINLEGLHPQSTTLFRIPDSTEHNTEATSCTYLLKVVCNRLDRVACSDQDGTFRW